MPKRSMNPIDAHVGARVRLRRMLVGMSQERLGELLGVTFQQVQKYEKGANRIGASRLYEVSQILEVPVQFFFDDLPAAARAYLRRREDLTGVAPAIVSVGPDREETLLLRNPFAV